MIRTIGAFAISSTGARLSRNLRRTIGRHRTATALIGCLASTILLAAPAAAQDTRGGDGGLGNVLPGPQGGTSSSTGTGGAGSSASESYEGGAGGGAGRIGGQGGGTFTGIAGGAGGATPGAQGADGTGGGVGSRATGGGGGAHGAVLNSMAFLGGAITGGRGGNGGSSADGDGGGGGAGGYGVVINANVANGFSFSVAITGGDGGRGGNGYFWGGGGGDGGHGLVFAAAASAELNAAVSGGNAGFGGTFLAGGCCNRGNNGTGGIGVVGRDAVLTINTAVSGGLNGDGVTRSLALSLGGTSRLTLGSGWSLDGGIRITDGSLNFLQDNNLTLGNDISGGGKLVKSGSGTLTLSGANSYTGGTRIEAGTLAMGSAAALGSGGVDLDGGTLDLRSNSFDLARGLTGTGTIIASSGGSLVVSGTNSLGSSGGGITSNLAIAVGSGRTLMLLGNNNLTGGITLSGRLVIGQTGAAGGSGNTITTTGSVISYAAGTNNTANINIASNSTQLEVQAGDVATQSGLISEDVSPRGFEKIGGGTLILSAANSYSGTAVVSAGILGLGVNGAASAGTISLANNTTLLNAASCGCGPLTLTNAIEVALGGTATIDADRYETVLSGSLSGGNLIFADSHGGGSIRLTNSNSYGDTTVGVGATLLVGDGGTSGTLGTGTITTDGVLAFDRSDDITLSTAIAGSGGFTQAGTGKLTLTGNNSYAGATKVTNGILQVGDGGTMGALGAGEIDVAATLVFNRSDDIIVANDILGSGTITKLGAGTVTLSGDNSLFDGTASVQGGTLAVKTLDQLHAGSLLEIGNGSRFQILGNLVPDEVDYFDGDLKILNTGGTIDVNAGTIAAFGGDARFDGLLTKTGAGTLILDTDGIGTGGIDVTAGTLGIAYDFAAGDGLISLASGTTLLAGGGCGCTPMIVLANNIAVATGGIVDFNANGGQMVLPGHLSGGDIRFISPDIDVAGSPTAQPGAFLLVGDGSYNSYGETRIGKNVAVIVGEGGLGTGNVVFENETSDPVTPASLIFSGDTSYSYDGLIIGAGTVVMQNVDPEQVVTLTGSNTATDNFTGSVYVMGGRLAINGSFGDVVGNSATMVVDGSSCGCMIPEASLGGSGVFHGSVTLGTASLDPGNSPGTLTIAGNLTLSAGTILNYELGAPGTPGGASNDLVNVGGDLVLDGTLNTIAAGAGYGPGYYRLFNYGGTLTDNELLIGSIAGGLDAQVLTNINGQVNLRLGGAQAIQYWDGADTGASTATGGNGGAGTWNSTTTNWTGPTGYAINDSWKSQVGVFAGAAGGVVTVDGTQGFEELRFETNGYVLRPADGSSGLSTTGGFSIIDVANGITVDIGVVIQGGAGLDKTGAGTLILSAANTYTGATDIAAGTLRLGTNNALSNQSALRVQAGAIVDLAGFTTQVGSLQDAGSITLNNGRLDTGFDNSSTVFSGTITGPDGGTSIFTKNGSGTLTLSGSIALGTSGGRNSFAEINGGTLRISGTGSFSGDYLDNLEILENSGTITVGQSIRNDGVLTNAGTGVINGSLANFGSAHIANQVNGDISNLQTGAVVTLDGTVTGIGNYLGVQGSLLDLAGFDTTVESLHYEGAGGDIQLGTATLTVSGALPLASFTGAIHGSGGLIKTGAGEQVLGGLNDYTGATVISGGTLRLIDGGAIGAGAVTNNATLAFDGALDRVFANTIQGSGGVTKTGTGLLALTGANGYAGTNAVLGGTLGFDNAQALGTGAITLSDGTRLRNLQGVSALSLSNAIQVAGTATLQGVDGSSTTFDGAISGGTVRFGLSGGGSTAFTLAAANSYGDTRIGGGVALTMGAGGTLGTGDIVFEANPIPSSLTFANSSNYSYAGVISGSGSIVVNTAAGASLTLSGSNTATDSFTGGVTVDSGKLVLGGDFGDVANNGASLTLNGGSLGGSGTFHGDVSFGNASLNPGNSPGTLNIAGNLLLGAATILNFELGEAGTVGGVNNDLVNVGGNLTLDGTLNVIAQPTFGEGYYRLFNYGGSLTDNGLNLGALPGGYSPTLLTNIAGQVNILFSSSPQAIQYWDGSDLTGSSTTAGGDGGAGIWSAANTNWTAPTGYGVNDSWHSQVAVFGGAAGGAVTVQGTQAFQELRFTTNGYTIAGATAADGLATTGGFSVVDVSTGVATTINAAISGTGGLTKTGTGTLSLGGANSYAGTTTVSAGQLNLLAGGSIAGGVVNQASFANAGTVTGAVQNDGIFTNGGTVTGAVQNNATLTSSGTLAGGLANNGTATLAGTVGTGIVNNGAVTFSDAATVAGLQQAAGGTFNLAGFGVSLGTLGGSGAISLGGGALSVGTGNGNSSFAGTISGAGSLTKAGTGTLVLTGTASQTGGTTISGGTLQIGTGGTTGALSGAITNNGVLVLNRSDAVTLSNVMSGTGGFVQAGTGTTTLTGANSYGGGTLVSAGRLRGDTASLQGAIRNDGTLEFAQTGAGTYAGSLSGAGLLEKTGTGTISFTGSSATFTGTTSVLAGTLALNGLLSHSTITVRNGATVMGTGTAGGLVVQSGGTIAPGNSVGTFNVAGNVLFQAGSLFAAEVQASGADRIQATGTAQLNGTLQIINLGGNYGINSSFVLLHADAGLSGTFTVSGLNGFGLAYRPKIIYTANEVQLLLAPNQLSAVLGTGVPLTYNQASTIGRLDAAVVTGGYDPTPLSALYSLAPAAIPAALDQLSGEIYADATRAALEDERVVREAVAGRLADAADAGLSGNGAWGQVIGSWGSVDGDGNAAGYDVNRAGMIMGLDGGSATEEGSVRAGVMGHYTRITVPADARGSRATIDRTGGGFYAGAAMGGLRVRAGVSLSLLDLKAKRQIVVPGLTATERGKAQGVMLQTFGEISYRIQAGARSFVEPYLAGSATRVRFNRFAESSGPVALIVREQKSVLGIAELGLRGEVPLAGGDTDGVRLGGNLGLRTAFGDRAANPAIALTAASGQAFNVRSAEIDRFATAANLNLSADLSDTLSLRIGYSGVLGGGVREHGGRAALSLRF